MAVIGIRLEDKNEWERRAPLIPDHVEALVESGLRVLAQPSERRIFEDAAYGVAGAEITTDLGEANAILAVKEVPLDKLLEGRAYIFFAHVIKGQPRNMPLLRRLLERNISLIDYERIVDENGRRLIFFSREAGQAGMLESLHWLGRRFEWEGISTPLSQIRRAFEYDDLEHAKSAMEEVGQRLRQGFDASDGPLVVAFTGRGQVSQGAQEIFDLLPHEEVTPEDLADLAENVGDVSDRLFKVRFGKEHLVQTKTAQRKAEGRAFDENEYREHPERYRGGRLVRFLPYVTVLMHGVFWNNSYPRFLTRQEAAAMWKAGGQKLRIIGDVTCDVDGSIELTHKSTTLDNPTYVYDPIQNTFRQGFEGPGIAVLAVDNLPCVLPRDASKNFSRVLRHYVPAIAAADFNQPFEQLDLPPEIRRAVITHQGRLTPDYQYLAKSLNDGGE